MKLNNKKCTSINIIGVHFLSIIARIFVKINAYCPFKQKKLCYYQLLYALLAIFCTPIILIGVQKLRVVRILCPQIFQKKNEKNLFRK